MGNNLTDSLRKARAKKEKVALRKERIEQHDKRVAAAIAARK